MQVSIKNIEENNKIFIHFTHQGDENGDGIIQYKMDAIAIIESKGKLFEEVKEFEKTNGLPKGCSVRGIIRAKLVRCVQFDG